MAFKLTVSKKKDALKESTGSSFIGASGIYDVKVNFVSLDQSAKGAVSFNMNLDYNGNSQTIYGSTVQNIDESTNEIGARLLNKLLVIAGMEEGQEPAMEEEVHNVGKDNKPQEFMCLTDLADLEFKIQVKQEFTKYEGKIRESMVPYNFFSAAGATADELTQKEEDDQIVLGAQLEKILGKEATTAPFYKANKKANEAAPTEEEVAAWIAAKKANKNGKAPAPKTAGTGASKFAKFK